MKKPEFSEFTFGYAFTNNFQAWLGNDFVGVPVFPNLVQEGRRGGGYDVAMSTQSEPFFFQFKIPQIVGKRSKLLPPGYHAPYYRMHMEPGAKSTQHESLLTHAQKGRHVYYVASRFDTLSDLGQYFKHSDVPGNCAFFSPLDIGELDGGSHFVAYKSMGQSAWLFSEPQELRSPRTAENVRGAIREAATAAGSHLPEDRGTYYSRLVEDLTGSIRDTAQRLRSRPLEAEQDERPREFRFEAVRPRDPDDILRLLDTAAGIDDPVDRLAHIATFALDAQLMLVRPRTR